MQIKWATQAKTKRPTGQRSMQNSFGEKAKFLKNGHERKSSRLYHEFVLSVYSNEILFADRLFVLYVCFS